MIKPKSKFLLIACNKCKNQQIIFDKASTKVKCLKCDSILLEPTGGKARIIGKIVKVLY